jgi:hypothetical protein
MKYLIINQSQIIRKIKRMAYNLTIDKIKQIDDNLTISGYLNEISYHLKEMKKKRNELGVPDHMKSEEKQLKRMRIALYLYRKKNASILKTSERQQFDDNGEQIDEDYYQFRSNGRHKGGRGLGKHSDARAYNKRHLYKIRGNIYIHDDE